MPRRIKALTCRSSLIAGAIFCALLPSPAKAQLPAPPPAKAPAQFDPSDVFFQGWLLCKDAEKLEQEDKHLEALKKLRKAQQLFDTIARTFPEWRPEMLQGRQKKTDDNIAQVMPEALETLDHQNRAVAELEGGVRRGASDDGQGPNRLETGLPDGQLVPSRQLDTLESRRIAELEAETQRLKRQIAANGTPSAAGREAARANDIERQRDLAISELRKAQTELAQLRQKSAQAPMQRELKALSRRINGLEDEKNVMAQALDSSRAETQEAKGQVNALQKERSRLMQEVADLKSNLEAERKISNEVVAGQRKQLQHFQELLKTKDLALTKANSRIGALETELAEVRDSFDDLREERDGLLRERDQLAALLKLNEAGQLQQVIDQNMALDRELRETKERYELLQSDNASTIYDLEESLRDLAISKLRIQEFRRDKQEQELRVSQLEARLRNEDRSLEGASGDPVEIELLRGIIQRQLKIQEKRGIARDLLMATLEKKAIGDEDIQRAINNFQGAELNLSPEELRAVDGQQVDGVIISPYARPRDEADRNIASLQRELMPYSKAGTRAYQNNRLHAAREAFEMIIERNPGDSNAMCKLGLVEYKLDEWFRSADMFRRASELDPRNPYAFRMLGHTLSRLGDNGDALIALERAVELSPTNSEGHLLLGNQQFRIGNLQAAEESFKMASSCDEVSAEPHYNLAILYANQGKRELANKEYLRALELGAAPNLDLEKRLQVSR